MDRRQRIGLTVAGIWFLFVVLLAIVTHRIVALGLLGLTPALTVPFRKRPSSGSSEPSARVQ